MTQQVTQQLEYKSENPKLNPGREYEVSVHAVTRSGAPSGMMIASASKFVISRPPSKSELDAAIAVVDKLELTPPIAAFLKAKRLAVGGQYELAIESLQQLRRQLDRPAITRELGEVYNAAGTLNEARKWLAEAVLLLEKDGDVVGEALALEALAFIQMKDSEPLSEAASRLRAAVAIYKNLGAAAEMQRLSTLLKLLEQVSAIRPRR